MSEYLPLVDAEISRRQAAEDTETLSASLRKFVPEAWKVLKPEEEYLHGWHLDVIAHHLEAVTAGEIKRLQIWVPRGTMKSLNVSVIWPAWEWTRNPSLMYWSASFSLELAKNLASDSLRLMMSPWYQARWGHKFDFVSTKEGDFSNNRGGKRLATAPGARAIGRHGHRIIIDDPIDATAANATSRVTLDDTNIWYDSAIEGTKARAKTAAEVIIMQRLHEEDLAGWAYRKMPAEWTIVCLPERYEPDHPFAYRRDPRKEGELLWPEKRDEKESRLLEIGLNSPYRVAGQMQQRPAAREGELLKRHWWRFYDPRLFTDGRMEKRRPRFVMVVQSIDTPLKDKQSNDLVAIQAWGVVGGDRYLLDLKSGHMNYGQAKRAVLEQARYVRTTFRRSAHHVLIENAGYGVELYEELRRELTGVHKLSRAHEGDKMLRAESAAADLETGNCFLPGYREGHDELSMPDQTRTAADVLGFVDECAMFPNGRYDDQVDAWSQAMNWIRGRSVTRTRTWSSFKAKR